MKLKFRNQKFQEDAARAVCKVFEGQPNATASWLIDKGALPELPGIEEVGTANFPPVLPEDIILENLKAVQRDNSLPVADKLLKSHSGKYNLTIEMETGVGKTYTYIKTMYELNRAYGWKKFIIVVPSIPIREGVFKSLQITEDHFAQLYNQKIRFFIYNSANLAELNRFATDSYLNVMIINSQAFNARGKDAKKIHMHLDSFGANRPIDIIKKTNPVLIIDEPQSVEGKVTREKLADFGAFLTLRYSATHKKDSIYNMVYRLDAQDAYNQRLVKKISVKGIHSSDSVAGSGYVYLESINITSANPTATLVYDYRGKKDLKRARRKLDEGASLFELSGGLEEYRNGYSISSINGIDGSVEFVNGMRLKIGESVGRPGQDELRRLQIRETIKSHLEKERQNFGMGIKTLSLFFIDEVARYRKYAEDGTQSDGLYASIFEEEYENLRAEALSQLPLDPAYEQWLRARPAKGSHAGYFSIDKKGGQTRFVNSEIRRGQDISEDIDAYTLIMKDKERLLDLNEPVRFIFSHSALREGWDNPNVFQICTLRESSSEIRRRQEVGRGLRLCVNSNGERMDGTRLGDDVDKVNTLTVIASESYDQFVKGLQKEISEAVTTRPEKVTIDLFLNAELRNEKGDILKIDKKLATNILAELRNNDYLGDDDHLTDKYRADVKNNNLILQEEVKPYASAFVNLLDSVFDPKAIVIDDGNKCEVELKVDEEKLNSKIFNDLWNSINTKSFYTVNFSEDELVQKAIDALNKDLEVRSILFTIQSGTMETIDSREALDEGKAFTRKKKEVKKSAALGSGSVKYDLLGKISEKTELTRAAVAKILMGIRPDVFNKFRENPEDFILKASEIINTQKATVIVEHITYNKLNSRMSKEEIFTDPGLRGKLGKNAMKTEKHLYDYLVYDSDGEKKFAEDLEAADNQVEIYVKLPKKFYIPTPVGHYNPDWAIAFRDGDTRHIYFVAETKGSLDSLNLRSIEQMKIEYAKKHFEALNSPNIKYDVVTDFQTLMNKLNS